MSKVLQVNGSFEGPPGKSAYEYAKDSGYTGTEEEFAEKLATNLQLDATLRDYTKAAPAGMVGKLKSDLSQLSEEIAEIPQADWNQNDGTAPDYVKNRTHYTKMDTVLEYDVLSGFEDDGSGVYLYILPYMLDFYDGLKVEVTWDNQVYQLTATQLFDGATFIGTFIGNKIVLGGEDSGEPFFIFTDKREGITMVGSTGTETSHEVGIVAESPVRIKPYFLPSNIAYIQNGIIPLNLVIPNVYDIFGMSITSGSNMESSLKKPYPNKVVLSGLTLETFNAMLDGTVSLPEKVLVDGNIASVYKRKYNGYIGVLWSSYVTYAIQGYELAGARILIYKARIHEDADNPGTIVSEYAVITVADKRLT